MKLLRIFQLEFTYQLRQVSTWMYFTVMLVLAFLLIHGNFVHDARDGYHLVNAPVIIGCVTVLCCVLWLLIGAAVAGDAAARDVHTRMFSLTYTAPVSKANYLGGRFLAAFLLNSLILLGITLGILLTMLFTGIESEILDSFRAASYLTSYFFLVFPNAFIATAVQFSMAALKRKVMAAFFGGALLFVTAYLIGQVVAGPMAMPVLGTLIDPMGFTPVLGKQSSWSTIELNTRLIELEGSFLLSRLLWIAISLALLALTFYRFQFSVPNAGSPVKKSKSATGISPGTIAIEWRTPDAPSQEKVCFNLVTRLQQLKFITVDSFRKIAAKASGLYLLAFIALVVGAAMPGNLKPKGVPMLASADQILLVLSGPITNPGKFWILIYLLTIFYAGELVWRERESAVAELSNPAPLPEWVLFLSRFFSLSLMLFCWLMFLTTAGTLAHIAIGGRNVEPGLYIKALFGFQLIECLLFSLLTLAIQVLVNQKYVAHLVSLLAFGCIMYASNLGLEHKLLIFSASPAWSYTSMGGFQSLVPWLWFKAYWIAWALLIAILAKLFWVRSREMSMMARLQQVRRRFSRNTAVALLSAAALVLFTGGFIFYHTNILNEYATSDEITAGRAEYEHRYAKYRKMAQPRLTGVDLQVEIYPEKQQFTVQGKYLLMNKQTVPVDTVLVAIQASAETKVIAFSQAASLVLADIDADVLTYALKEPLLPGGMLQMDFHIDYTARGFTNNGTPAVVKTNGTNFSSREYLPVIGYQPYRELDEAGKRRDHKLAQRDVNFSLYDLNARKYAPFAEHISFNAVVGTNSDQIAVAPGTLRKTWTKADRKYFHYASDGLIRNEYSFFSAKYALHEETWKPAGDSARPVAIQIFNDPGHAENIARMMKSVKASLAHYTKVFGPYPHKQIRFVSYPGYGMGNHASPINITAEEGFFLLNPDAEERGFDLVTAVVAHEVAHQWWGNQLRYSYIEGAGLLSESLAWYSAMGVMEEQYGPEHLNKLLNFLREEYETPRTRAAVPLLRAADFYQNYRKGPLALYAMSKYIGKNHVNAAIRQLLTKHSQPGQALGNSLDLYHELRSLTPDSLRYLLDDLFKRNTFWDLKAKQAEAKKTNDGQWELSLAIKAQKSVVSARGLVKEVPLSDWIEVGVYAPPEKDGQPPKVLYLGKHLINSKVQTVTIKVARKPAQAGIDPNYLLVDWNINDNVTVVKSEDGF